MKHQIEYTDITREELTSLNALIDQNFVELNRYADELLWWNNKINLVSRGVSRETIFEHIKHSLLISTIESFIKAEEIIDTGTGGGLPGIPLALCYPEKNFLLNDIVSKKMMAAKQMVGKLQLKNITTNSSSIANVEVEGALVISKHAFKIFELTGYLKGKNWDKIIFLKGAKEVEEELKKVKAPLKVTVTVLDQLIKAEFYRGKSIVEVKRISDEEF